MSPALEQIQVSQSLPSQRWQIGHPDPQVVEQIAQATQLSPLLARVLVNHGITTPQEAEAFLSPETQQLPSPLTEFPDLKLSLQLLEQAITQQHKIAICGDYDADGMTSTALLLRAFKGLGAYADYAIPSRMREGYGINKRIVEEFAAEGVQLILTVDNGIAAVQPIVRARALGMEVIVTDHHDLPPELPPANAILNPKLLASTSPYHGVAGVGVAYILAASLAQKLGKTQHLVTPLLELFTLGTIADLAPLLGVNRRWLKRGLKLLPRSQLAGVQALMQVSGCHSSSSSGKALKPEAVGFRLGPRINAVGRIANPQTVINLLTTDDAGIALDRAIQCEQINGERQHLCRQIEQEAIALIEAARTQPIDPDLDPQGQRVLVIVRPHWHHGVIGIVASRLVERYGVPVFIGTYEDESQTQIRGSARGIPEFDVFAALQACDPWLEKYGGHRAAGGFSLAASNLDGLRSQLRQFAHQQLQPQHLKPLVTIDTKVDFAQITWELYGQIDRLHPCGIGNPEPVFWTPQVEVVDQRIVGRDSGHLKLTLRQWEPNLPDEPVSIKAMAWRWGEYYPLPQWVDVAYRLRDNAWNGNHSLELELMGCRPAQPPCLGQSSPPSAAIGLLCSQPPCPSKATSPTWCDWEPLDTLLPKLEGHLLLYGYQRPYQSEALVRGALEYDRPRCPCDVLLLWTLPPSWTHLQWLLALGQPSRIYVRNQIPPFLEERELRSQLRFMIATKPAVSLNLLELGQQWWVAPSTIVAVLRDLGYACSDFPATQSLEQELQRLQRWYQCSALQLANLN